MVLSVWGVPYGTMPWPDYLGPYHCPAIGNIVVGTSATQDSGTMYLICPAAPGWLSYDSIFGPSNSEPTNSRRYSRISATATPFLGNFSCSDHSFFVAAMVVTILQR